MVHVYNERDFVNNAALKLVWCLATLQFNIVTGHYSDGVILMKRVLLLLLLWFSLLGYFLEKKIMHGIGCCYTVSW